MYGVDLWKENSCALNRILQIVENNISIHAMFWHDFQLELHDKEKIELSINFQFDGPNKVKAHVN